jgi:O-antigen ligase
MASVLVPLIVLPESNFVDITSTPKTTVLRMLGSLQAGVLLSRLIIMLSSPNDQRLRNAMNPIRSSRPALAILGSVAAVTIVSIISAAFAILPAQSWWGRYAAGFEAGEYSALMYVVLSISAYISVRESVGHKLLGRDSLWNVLAITGVLASLVGFLQYLGFPPLDISSSHPMRISGTNGNPIFFGAMLVVLVPITFGILISRYLTAGVAIKRWWLIALAVFSFIALISFTATVSRGPWVGGLAGGVVGVAILAMYCRSKVNLLPLALIVIFSIAGAILVTLVDPTPPEITPLDETGEGAGVEVSQALVRVTYTGTIDLRLRYWKMSANMAATRDPVPYTNNAPKFLRFLFGYGPDMFRFAGTYYADITTFTHRLTAAHNDPVNRLVEQGILGLAAWIALWVSIVFAVWKLVRRAGRTPDNPRIWLVIGIAVALAGRFTEQLSGSPTPGGVLVFWLIVGGLAALLIDSNALPNAEKRSDIPAKFRIPQFAVYGAMLVVIGASVVMAWDRGANYLIANQMASFQRRGITVTAEDAVNRLENASMLAPDVPRYLHDLADIKHDRAIATLDPQKRAEALSQAYKYDLKAYQINPIEVASIYRLAFSAWESGKVGRPEIKQEAIELYRKLVIIIPSDNLARERLKLLEGLSEN